MKRIITLKEPADKISKSYDLFDKIKKIDIDYTQENFIVFSVNTKNQVINSKLLFIGGLDSCVIDPRTIFRTALLNNASSIFVAHNHPSGCLKPSTEDLEIFKILKECGDILLLKCLDSIIFNEKEYLSLLEYTL